MGEVAAHDRLPLRTVSRLTGLTPDIIRAWEKRYAVVAPRRGPRGARLYTTGDVARLRLLRAVVASGRAIGDVARLPPTQLTALIGLPDQRDEQPARAAAAPELVARALEALERFDAVSLDRWLADSFVALGSGGFVEKVACPLLDEIGVRWSDRRLSVADEHLVSGLLRNLLAGVLRTRHAAERPTMLLTTPSGERHELGLMLAALLIADAGVPLCYLGTDLPAGDIAAAARRARVAVVGLSVVNGDNRAGAIAAIQRLDRELPAATELWIGGREAAAVVAEVGRTRAVVVDGMTKLDAELARFRTHGASIA